MVKKYLIMTVIACALLSQVVVAKRCKTGRCGERTKKREQRIRRAVSRKIAGMGQGAVAARGLAINAQGVPENIVAASYRATSFSADPDVAQELQLHLEEAIPPSSGDTERSEPPQKLAIAGRDHYIFFDNEEGSVVIIDEYIPYRLNGETWEPWPDFWKLWPWWWGYNISPGLPSCYECEKMGCPYGFDCPPECAYCEI